jgi:hypothetical protein
VQWINSPKGSCGRLSVSRVMWLKKARLFSVRLCPSEKHQKVEHFLVVFRSFPPKRKGAIAGSEHTNSSTKQADRKSEGAVTSVVGKDDEYF